MSLLSLLALAVALLAPFSAAAALLLLPALLISRRGRSAMGWYGAAWLLWIPATLAWSPSPGFSLPQVASLLCLPLALLAGRYLREQGQLRPLLRRALPALLLILLVWGLGQGPNTFTYKPQGPFNDPNAYAAVLNLLLLPLLANYLAADLARQAPWRRVGQLALLAGAALMAFLVASRGASLALVLVLPPLLWLARKHPDFPRKLALLAGVSLLAALAAHALGGGVSVLQRLAETVQEGDAPRYMLLQAAARMIQDHPWLGTGLGGFRLLYPRYRLFAEADTAGGWIHNDYLQLWLETGLPGLLLLLGLAVWTAWAGWRTLRGGGPAALQRLGYLAAIAAILIHALVNFLIFFDLVGLLLGLYLARLAPPWSKGGRGDAYGPDDVEPELPAPLCPRGEHARAFRMAATGYALILGWLLLGQVAVEGLLAQARPIQQALLRWNVTYPRYEIAYWLTVLAPFHPAPRQALGQELASITGGDGPMRDAALARMDAAMRLAPCYLPYANDALDLIRQGLPDAALGGRGQTIVAASLVCNPRHGLSFYYAGLLATSEPQALAWWRAGLAASPFLADRLLLATALLSRTTPGHGAELATLAEQMARAIRDLEATPGIRPDQDFWSTAQYRLLRIAGRRFLDLVPPPPR